MKKCCLKLLESKTQSDSKSRTNAAAVAPSLSETCWALVSYDSRSFQNESGFPFPFAQMNARNASPRWKLDKNEQHAFFKITVKMSLTVLIRVIIFGIKDIRRFTKTKFKSKAKNRVKIIIWDILTKFSIRYNFSEIKKFSKIRCAPKNSPKLRKTKLKAMKQVMKKKMKLVNFGDWNSQIQWFFPESQFAGMRRWLPNVDFNNLQSSIFSAKAEVKNNLLLFANKTSLRLKTDKFYASNWTLSAKKKTTVSLFQEGRPCLSTSICLIQLLFLSKWVYVFKQSSWFVCESAAEQPSYLSIVLYTICAQV